MTSIMTTRPTWATDGVLVIPDAITGTALMSLRGFVAEVAALPGTVDGLMHYDEQTPDGRTVRTRTENFIGHHKGLREILTTGLIPEVANEAMGERAVLLKEKINYKAPGGAGYKPHQDAAAYSTVSHTIACLVCIDDMTADNGGLEVVRGVRQVLPTGPDGCLTDDAVAGLTWEQLPLRAGSLLFFDGLIPHRSGRNTTSMDRRAIYLTYHPASAGNLRDAYYADRAPKVQHHPGRLSTIGHFEGEATANVQY